MPCPAPCLFCLMIFVGACFCGAGSAQVAGQRTTPAADPLTWQGSLREKDITESSGLARAAVMVDAFWTMNDSGNKAELFLFTSKGKSVARCELKGARNRDWEAMSVWNHGGDRFVAIAETGDNIRQYKTYSVYFAAEPTIVPDPKKVHQDPMHAVGLKFLFDGGAMNCEAMGIPPNSNDVFFVEKQFGETKATRLPVIQKLPLPVDDLTARLKLPPERRVGDLPKTYKTQKVGEFPVYGVTGMAFSPDGKRVVIRSYLEMYLFEKHGVANAAGKDGHAQTWTEIFQNQKPTVLPLPLQQQGEAVCFSADSQNVYVTSEKSGQPIWKVHIDGLIKQLAEED